MLTCCEEVQEMYTILDTKKLLLTKMTFKIVCRRGIFSPAFSWLLSKAIPDRASSECRKDQLGIQMKVPDAGEAPSSISSGLSNTFF